MGTCRALTNEEAESLLAAVRGRHALRDRAWICVGLYLGFRIAEILSLRVGDVMDEDGHLRPTVRVGAKAMKGHGKPRTIAMDHPVVCRAVGEWIDELRRRGWQTRVAYLFQSGRKGPPPAGRAISTRQADYILAHLKRAAGLRGVVASHSLRKTAARWTLEIIGDHPEEAVRKRSVVYLQRWMGHGSLASTQHYIETEDAVLAEVGRQFPPLNFRVPAE